jgi:superfamily II helicase
MMVDSLGNRRKLIIFTEPKDTLYYLHDRVRSRLGRADAVEVIHGGVSREDRRKIVERFMQDRDMLVLIANDAAGEGVSEYAGVPYGRVEAARWAEGSHALVPRMGRDRQGHG